MVTTFEAGRMIWNGYTGAAGWMFRQALEGVLGLRLVNGEIVAPADRTPAGDLNLVRVSRDVSGSPFSRPVQRTTDAQRTPRMNAEKPPEKKWTALFSF